MTLRVDLEIPRVSLSRYCTGRAIQHLLTAVGVSRVPSCTCAATALISSGVWGVWGVFDVADEGLGVR